MKKQCGWMVAGVVCCCIGAIIYGVYRPTTYVGELVGHIFMIPLSTNLPLDSFFSYYFPDYLWGLALTFALFSVSSSNKTAFANAVLSAICGVAWELMQAGAIVSGTFDMKDIVMYITASLTAVTIKILFLKGDLYMKKLVSILLVAVIVFTFGVFALGSSEDENTVVDQGTASNTDNSKEDVTTLGDYKVDIKSHRLAKDYEGKDVIIITYGFTNVSDKDAASFAATINDTVFQNGVGLNEAYFMDDSSNYSSDNQLKEIKAGASLDVEVAYELNDTSTDVVVEVGELFSLDNDKTLTKTFTIA